MVPSADRQLPGRAGKGATRYAFLEDGMARLMVLYKTRLFRTRH